MLGAALVGLGRSCCSESGVGRGGLAAGSRGAAAGAKKRRAIERVQGAGSAARANRKIAADTAERGARTQGAKRGSECVGFWGTGGERRSDESQPGFSTRCTVAEKPELALLGPCQYGRTHHRHRGERKRPEHLVDCNCVRRFAEDD